MSLQVYIYLHNTQLFMSSRNEYLMLWTTGQGRSVSMPLDQVGPWTHCHLCPPDMMVKDKGKAGMMHNSQGREIIQLVLSIICTQVGKFVALKRKMKLCSGIPNEMAKVSFCPYRVHRLHYVGKNHILPPTPLKSPLRCSDVSRPQWLLSLLIIPVLSRAIRH